MARPKYRRQIDEMPAHELAETLVQFDRRTLAGFVEAAISILDCADGDPDAAINYWDDEDSDPDVEYDCREDEENIVPLFGIDQTVLQLWAPTKAEAHDVR